MARALVAVGAGESYRAASYRRWAWPTNGSIILDHLGFRIRELRPDGTPKTGPVAFNVLAAQGYENGSPFL